MLLRRFYDTRLAQASYLVGCQSTGQALVVDPNRDSEQYLTAARAEGLSITHVTETHIHADFLSGSRQLARRAGATLYLSDEGGPDWRYGFAKDDGATLLKDSDRVMVGNIRFEALHTPGHTPEHLSFLVTDGKATDRPMGAFTGDFIFVGDVGRPDLLERAAGLAGTMESAARQLYRSLQAFKQRPDYLQLWPAHGAGSACGKALGAVPSSTLGYERFANWALKVESEDEFVARVLSGQPEPPRYFAQMKRLNRDGPPVLERWPEPARLPAARLAEVLRAGGVVVDLRRTADHARAHVPGTLNVPWSTSFTSYAGQVLPYDRPLYLVAGDAGGGPVVAEAVQALGMIGLDRVEGVFGSEALEGAALEATEQVAAELVAPRLARGEVVVVDVRARTEWDEGHLPGARHLALAALAERMDELPRDADLVLHCETGSRSAVAASLLRAHGLARVANLAGGITAWKRAGLPVETESPAGAGTAG